MGFSASDLEISNNDFGEISPLVAVWKFEQMLQPGNFSEKKIAKILPFLPKDFFLTTAQTKTMLEISSLSSLVAAIKELPRTGNLKNLEISTT